MFRAAIAISPRAAAAHHALGLTLTRLKQQEAALPEFRSAAEFEPDAARYQYVYAVALHSAGQRDQAIAVLKDSLNSHPSNREILQALVSFNQMAGDAKAALGYAEQLAVIMPDDHGLAALILDLRGAIRSPAQ